MKFIASSDYHLQINKPRCRIDDDWLLFQKTILKQIALEANKRKVPVYCLGDVFDTAKVPPIIVSMFLNFVALVDKGVKVIAGNHSLPYHSWENVSESSFGIIDEIVNGMRERDILSYYDDVGKYSHFNEELKGKDTGLLFIHRLVFKLNKDMPPNVNAISAQDLLNEFKEMNWIFCGDMHRAFHYEKNGRHVVNPGAIYRGNADEKYYKPSVFYVDTEKEIVERIYLDDNVEMIDDIYLQKEEERDNRITAFVEGIKKSTNISLSIIDNIEKAIKKNNKTLDEDTIKMIRSLVED